jgi:four helix bundle protein
MKSNDLKIRTYDFSIEIIKFINSLPNKRAFWSIGDQLLRSATSIGANIIEAKASSSRKEFIKYYEIALKSANESKVWLSLLKDSLPQEFRDEASFLLKESIEISNILGKIMTTLRRK